MDIVHFDKSYLCGKSIYVRKKQSNTDYPICHRHNYYEIIYYSGCIGSCSLNGTDYTINNSSLFLVTPSDYHKISTSYRRESYSVNISFLPDAAEKQLINEIGFTPFACENISESIKTQIDALYHEFSENKRLCEIKLKARLNLLLSELLEAEKETPLSPEPMNGYAKRIMEYISSNPTSEITLEDCANRMGLAASYLSSVFHSSVGVTFKTYLNTVRTEYAKRLLEETTLSVTAIALEAGFSTPSQFFRTFKKHTAVTPLEWRNGKH